MRVVIDTNVFISATLKENSLPSIAVHLASRYGTFLKSGATEQQILDVVAWPYFDRIIAVTTRDWIGSLLAAAELVTITERVAACRDHTDDKFLELAVNGRSDLIISGDNDLLVLNPFRDIPIVAPSAFVQALIR